MLKLALIFISFGIVVGCASNPARVGSMTAESQNSIDSSSRFYQTIELGSVSGSDKKVWGPDVTNESFEAALEASLKRFRLISMQGKGRYVLDTILQHVDTPHVALEFTAEAKVNYKLIEKQTGKIILNKTISSSAKVPLSESILGSTRGRLARERAVKGNFEKFFSTLQTIN